MNTLSGINGWSLPRETHVETTAPGVGDDILDGFAPGSRWTNTTAKKTYTCVDATAGAAVWTQLGTPTLDGAYDMGGAGAGRTITADAGAVTINAAGNNALALTLATTLTISALAVTEDNVIRTAAMVSLARQANATGIVLQILRPAAAAVATDSVIGLDLQNATDAAVGAQQWSPLLVFEGQGWKTDATAASQEVQFALQAQSVQGTANPTGNFAVMKNINDAGFSTLWNFSSAGDLVVGTRGFKLDLSGDGAEYITSSADSNINVFTNGTQKFLFDASLNYSNVALGMSGNIFYLDANLTAGLRYQTTAGSVGVIAFVPDGVRSWTFVDYSRLALAHGHGTPTNPTIWIHAASATTTLWGSLSHDATDFVIATGAGDVKLAPAGNVAFGTYAAIGAEVLAGYITIKDAAGNSRKLAVIA